jgi:hypothetical protein
MKLQAATRLAAADRNLFILQQTLAKLLRPLGARFLKQTGNNFFFRTEDKVTQQQILDALATVKESQVKGTNVTINHLSPLGIVYEETFRVFTNDEDPESKIFNLLLED